MHARAVKLVGWFVMATLLLLQTPDTAPAGALRTLRSAHYLVHTDLDAALAEELARRLDVMYDEYARRLASFNQLNPEQKFEIYLFAKREDYGKLTQNRIPNTGGVFMPGRNLLASFLEGQGRDALRRVIQHEAFHQFAFAAISTDMPIWLNEGMAQYFEEGIWTGTHFIFGQVPQRRLRQLQHDIDRKQIVPFRTMLTMSDEQWGRNLTTDAARGATQYTQAWAMTHFLIHGANGNDPYRPRLINMLRLIHGGARPTDAFVEAFSRNVDGFQARFEEYVKQLSATPEATLIERQDVLADLLQECARVGQTFSSVRDFREAMVDSGARLRYAKGQVKWETSEDVEVYFATLYNRPLQGHELYFEPRRGAPLPDLVCRTGNLWLRTRFYPSGEEIEHEILCEKQVR